MFQYLWICTRCTPPPANITPNMLPAVSTPRTLSIILTTLTTKMLTAQTGDDLHYYDMFTSKTNFNKIHKPLNAPPSQPNLTKTLKHD